MITITIITLTISTSFTRAQSQQAASQNNQQQKLPSSDAFSAIKSLHTKLDHDNDGEVEAFESKKFLESDKHGERKLNYLHQDGKDTSISVEELWEAWTSSHVHNWTVDETVYWLAYHVELPEYSSMFEQNNINGTQLPRLATDSQFISKLGINEPTAKHKISIKAMDVVLFGPPKSGSYNKIRDIIVAIVIVTAISSCYIFYSRLLASQQALRAMQHHVESLQKEEDRMSALQEELNKAQRAQEAVATEKKNLEHQLEMQRQFSASNLSDGSSRIANNKQNNGDNISVSARSDTNDTNDLQLDAVVAKLEGEVKSLREELQKTYDSMAEKKFRAPFPLRSLLKATYDIESQYYDEKKLSLESKANEVKMRNQKLQKKKTSFLSYYKLAQENSLEEDINTIVEVKEAIMQVTREIKERTERWRAIEEHCGCSLDLRHHSEK